MLDDVVGPRGTVRTQTALEGTDARVRSLMPHHVDQGLGSVGAVAARGTVSTTGTAATAQ
jgi:hypothetical protein